MSLYDVLSQEQLNVKVKLDKQIGTVFDLSYILIDLQSVVNGLAELIDSLSQKETFAIVANYLPITEDYIEDAYTQESRMHPQWQRKVENDVESILYPEREDKKKVYAKPAQGYKQTTNRRFNEKYRMNLRLLNFQKGSLILDLATPVIAGLILEFIKELIYKKTGKRDIFQINIQNNYIKINESDITVITKSRCIPNVHVMKDGTGTIDIKAMIDGIIRTAKPDENIESSVNRFLTVIREENIIDQSETYDIRGVKTFVRDADRLIGNLIDMKA